MDPIIAEESGTGNGRLRIGHAVPTMTPNDRPRLDREMQVVPVTASDKALTEGRTQGGVCFPLLAVPELRGLVRTCW